MQKKLTTAGNSLALVIEKPLQRMLGLQNSRRVWIRVDGAKLVIEAVRDGADEGLPQQVARPKVGAVAQPQAEMHPADLAALRLVRALIWEPVIDEAVRRFPTPTPTPTPAPTPGAPT